MKQIAIITGVTGQVGSYFAEFLIGKGFEVVGTCRRLSVPNRANTESLSSSDGFTMETMDLGDSHSIDTLINNYKPNYFINCAANSFVANSWICPEQHIDYNCNGVIRQLEAIRKHSPKTIYINAGSSEEFGDVIYSPQNESHPARARSIYGVSKIAARQAIKVYRESYDLYALQYWAFNHESPRRGEEFLTRKVTKNVARISNSLSKGQKFEPMKLGNIYSKRDWSHAIDIVRGVWMMANQIKHPQLGVNGGKHKIEEYIFSSGETHSIKEFVELAFNRVNIKGIWSGEGIDEKFLLDEYEGNKVDGHRTLISIDEKFYRPADVETLHGDYSKALDDLGWRPKISFKELVESMVDNDVENEKKNSQ